MKSVGKVHLLVICSQKENYFNLLKDKKLENGDEIIVDQAPWVDIEITSFPDNLVVHMKPNRNPFPYSNQGTFRSFTPDFVLLRSYALGNHEHDWRRKLFAFAHFDIPCLNSIDSFMWSIEKATLWGKMRRIQKRCADFPLIPQTYYSHPSSGSFPPDFPCVVKVGSSSQGVGKSRVMDSEQWRDTLSLLSMTTEYFVSEPFVEWVSDIRVQKIGSHYRAVERKKMDYHTTTWKANEPVGITENDIDVEHRWRKWVDVASEELQMEILGMDLIVDKNGKEFVLEINSSSIGFPARHAAEDCGYICELLMQKLNQTFGNWGASMVPWFSSQLNNNEIQMAKKVFAEIKEEKKKEEEKAEVKKSKEKEAKEVKQNDRKEVEEKAKKEEIKKKRFFG